MSIWTPDLIEAEQRAKDRARVLFFVIDSRTRSVVSSIEVAYIAAQNPSHLVLVFIPSNPNQSISNEIISSQ